MAGFQVSIDGRFWVSTEDPVALNREMDPTTLDRVWAARLQKLQKPEVQARQPGGGGEPPSLDTPRPNSWWSFRVVSRS